MKTKNNYLHILVKFLLIEVFSIILNYLLCKIHFVNMNGDYFILFKAIRISIVILINSILCIAFVFNDKFKLKNILLLISVSIFSLLLRNFLLFFLSRHHLYLKGLSLNIFTYVFFLAVDMYLKLKILKFDKLLNEFYCYIKKVFSYLNSKWIRLLEKMKYLNMFIPRNIFIFIFSILIIGSIINFYHANNDIVLYEQNNLNSNVGPIISDEIVSGFQDISISDDANIVCLKFATYNRINDGLLSVKLYNHKSKLIYSKKVKTSNLSDGSNYCFKVPKINKEQVGLYKLKIKAIKVDNNNYVTIYKDSRTNKIAMSLHKTNNSILKKLMILLIILFYLFINIIINIFSNKISESKFLLLMLLYIIPIIFVYPPYSNPDEKVHFYQSYSTSQALEISHSKKIILPENIGCLNYTGLNYRVDNLDNIVQCNKNGKNRKYFTSKLSDIKQDIAPSSVSIGYIFQSLAIKVTDIFTNSPLLLYYISKFLASLASFIIIYFSLKSVSAYKKVLLFLVTMPMFIQQMCSFSYDSILNSVIIMFFACYINILTKKDKINFYNLLPMLFACVYLMIIKIVYIPLLFLLFVIPSNKFGNKKNKWLNIIILFALSSIFVYLIKNIFISNSIISYTGKQQLNYILNNPLYIIDVLKNTFLLDSWNYVKGLFGFFSWFKFGFDDITIVINIVFILLLFRSECNLINIKKIRLIVFAILFLSISLIFGSMYFCWDYNYKLNYIAGVQGRYFLPLLPLLFLLMVPKHSKIKLSNQTVYSFINIMLFMHLIYSLIYFY